MSWLAGVSSGQASPPPPPSPPGGIAGMAQSPPPPPSPPGMPCLLLALLYPISCKCRLSRALLASRCAAWTAAASSDNMTGLLTLPLTAGGIAGVAQSPPPPPSPPGTPLQVAGTLRRVALSSLPSATASRAALAPALQLPARAALRLPAGTAACAAANTMALCRWHRWRRTVASPTS